MSTFAYPDYRDNAITDAQIEKVRANGFVSQNIVGSASKQSWPLEGPAKYWRDNSPLWGFPGPFYYVMPVRDSNGQIEAVLPIPSGHSEADETFTILSSNATNHLRLNAAKIGRIPKLKLVEMSAKEAGRMSFVAGYSIDFPVALLLPDEGGQIVVNKRADGSIWAGPSGGVSAGKYRCGGQLDGGWYLRFTASGSIEYVSIYG